MALRQEHHGISVTDLAAMERALVPLGFTAVQPNAPEPLVYRDAPDDPVGQLTCGVLSDPYRTRYVENPATGQQIDLIEIDPSGLSPRPGPGPAQGDLVIGIPADAPREALERVRDQASIQLRARRLDEPQFEILEPVDATHGLAMLPAPSSMDFFLDLEGDRLAAAGGRDATREGEAS